MEEIKTIREKKKLNKLKVLSIAIVVTSCFTGITPTSNPITDRLEKLSHGNYSVLGKYAAMLNCDEKVLDSLLIKKAYADDEIIGSGGSSNTQIVNSGDNTNGVTVNNNGLQTVYGSASDTTINSGGGQWIYGSANNTTVNSNGIQLIKLGGIATNTIVGSNGQITVDSGGSATNVTLSEGAVINAHTSSTLIGTYNGVAFSISGGIANNIVLNSFPTSSLSRYGHLYVDSGGIANNTTINNGSYEHVDGGTSNGTTVNSGGTQNVSNSGISNDATINSGGIQNVYADGIANDTIVNSGGNQYIWKNGSSASGIANGTIVNSGGTQYVTDTGVSNSTMVNSGGIQWVYVNGTSNQTVISSAGKQYVTGGGISNHTVVNSGGTQYVYSITGSGISNGTIVNSGGLQYVYNTGVVRDTTINPGGEMRFQAGATISGTTTLESGTINVIGNSSALISNLNTNGGIVNFNPTSSGSPTYNNTLTISNLSGTGTIFKITTDGQNNRGNKINIVSAAGNYNLAIRDLAMQNGASVTFSSPLTVVNVTNDGGSTFNSIPIDSGAYRYTPTVIRSGNDWQLVSVTSGASEASMTGKDSLVANIEVVKTIDNNLMKRMGDLRHNQGEAGYWMRLYTGKQEVNLSRHLDYSYDALQLGYDKKTKVNNGTWYTGLAVERVEGDTTYERGSGEDNGTDIGLYGTWLADNGHYLDIIAKRIWSDTEYKTWDLFNNQSRGSYSNKGISFSMEYGYQKQLKQGWYIEPQLEAIFGHVGSVDYQDSQGVNIHQDSVDSKIGRLGLIIGRQVGEKTRTTNFYLKTSIAHEFDGEMNMRADTLEMSEDLKGTWYELGLGIASRVDDDNDVYFDLEKVEGDKVRSPWKLNLGLRWEI